MSEAANKYDDIINLPRHVSPTRTPMTNYDRAAQFAPFAALTGYGDEIDETARLTDNEIYLDEDKKAELDGKLREIRENIGELPEAIITCFIPDEYKQGGAYVDISGKIKKIDENESAVIFTNGEKIPVNRIYDIKIKSVD
ncbi:MAG: YolD-like family protein [Clostridia bacterium]|nr:YolD-like family protein [Clostridia bacterium]